jgi:hypothetical protein
LFQVKSGSSKLPEIWRRNVSLLFFRAVLAASVGVLRKLTVVPCVVRAGQDWVIGCCTAELGTGSSDWFGSPTSAAVLSSAGAVRRVGLLAAAVSEIAIIKPRIAIVLTVRQRTLRGFLSE